MKKTFIVLFLLAALLPADSKPIKFTLGNWLWKPASNQALLTTSSPTFAGLTLSGGTASTLAYLNGSKAFTSLANGAGYLLNDGSGGLSWGASIPATAGGTGQTSYAIGDLLYAPTTTTIGKLADVAAGQVLVSGGVGVAPAWSASPTLTGNVTAAIFHGGAGSVSTPPFGLVGATPGTYNCGVLATATTIDLVFSGTSVVSSSGSAINFLPATMFLGGSGSLILKGSAGVMQIGNDSSSATTNQTIRAHGRTGTNATGANLTVLGGNSTGSGSGGSVIVATTPAGASGSTVNTSVNRVEINSDGDLKHLGSNSQSMNIQQATVVVTTTAAATATATNLIPAGSMVVGVTCRNTTAVTGDAGFTGYSIGDGTDPDRWGANVNPAINETTDLTDCTITSPAIYAAATSIVLTQIGGSTFVADATVRVTVHYISLTAPST